MGWGCGAGVGPVASSFLAVELCAPLLLLCWLCCWPDDASDSSSSGHPRKPVLANGTSTGSPSLAARSHDDLTLARMSAPEVIREVMMRRDWDRSARELFIPLHPDQETFSSPHSPRSPLAPHASPEDLDPPCKKHHTNIKGRKELRAAPPERDEESPSSFYIGDDSENDRMEDKPLCPGKEEKQSMNESIRCKERPWRLAAAESGLPGLAVDEVDVMDAIDMMSTATPDAPDRSGAVHHALDSRAAADMGYTRIVPFSPVSVEVVGYEYESGTYDDEADRLTLVPSTPVAPGTAARARHASDGDILGPAPRPESGAFSESDLDLELRLALQAEQLQEREEFQEPPAIPRPLHAERRETAI